MGKSSDFKKFKNGYVIWDNGDVVPCCYCKDEDAEGYVYVFDGERVWTVAVDHVWDYMPPRETILEERIAILEEQIEERTKDLCDYIREEEENRGTLEETQQARRTASANIKQMKHLQEKYRKELEKENGGGNESK